MYYACTYTISQGRNFQLFSIIFGDFKPPSRRGDLRLLTRIWEYSARNPIFIVSDSRRVEAGAPEAKGWIRWQPRRTKMQENAAVVAKRPGILNGNKVLFFTELNLTPDTDTGTDNLTTRLRSTHFRALDGRGSWHGHGSSRCTNDGHLFKQIPYPQSQQVCVYLSLKSNCCYAFPDSVPALKHARSQSQTAFVP